MAVTESDILRSVHAILRELDGHHPASQFNRGMLRWTLHKKIERNPASNCTLVRVVIKELEKAEKADNKLYIIPLIHTLMYGFIQATDIPDQLYKRVYDFCTRLLTLPQPYCSIGFSYANSVKTERSTPGVLYHRLLASEQNLKNDHYTYQERVFVFADPSLFSEEMSAALAEEFESADICRSQSSYMCDGILHIMQAALGGSCCTRRLGRALQSKEQDMIELYFQELVAIVEQSAEDVGGNRSQYVEKLRQLYLTITGPTTRAFDESMTGAPSGISIPNPNISFHMWNEDTLLWQELSKVIKRGFSRADSEFFDLQDSIADLTSTDMIRLSILSTDSGIERDLPLSEMLPVIEEPGSSKGEPEQGRLVRKGGIKMKPSITDTIASSAEETVTCPPGKLQRRSGSQGISGSRSQRQYTARVVLLGDDRILGKMAKAYYSIRKREARRPFLLPKMNLHIYCIPVCNSQPGSPSTELEYLSAEKMDTCQLAAYLGRADPWYESNINSLSHMIPKLAKMNCCSGKTSAANPFLVDIISYYVRMGQQPVYFCIYSVKISFSCLTKEAVEDVFLTQAEICIPESPSAGENTLTRKRNMTESFGAVLSVTYKKASLSNRECEKSLTLRTSGVVINAIPSCTTEDFDCLTICFSDGLKVKSTEDSKIRASSIKIRSLEQKSFNVCFDKDHRRVYKEVSSIEVSPCLDPGFCLQKKRDTKFFFGEDQNVGLTQYMPKGLSLAINTFAGIIR
ncbi:phosphoinositide 3-kinase regulatory subunit 6-like isoform X2 [Erpetoichthys calabaricus]|nr:phosphoinositide 3-kinase regulatory subunit 6-like isoform X2 [Erpetoichthys calabaricus]